MTFDVKKLTPKQTEALKAELAKRKVKFLPAQAVRRAVGDDSKFKVLSAHRRNKAKKIANREQALKQAASQAAAAVKK